MEQRPDRHVVTWSCDGPFPARRRPARLHSTPAGLGEATTGRATDRPADDTHQSGETERPGVSAPGVIRLFASLIPRARAPPTWRKNFAPELAAVRKSDSSNLYVDAVPVFFSII